ncbi:MAG TPA: TAXI family TRAP transporter solute-binding subunit, partial [Candidatus Thermoplasmatota archaeon]|nr:TAXI family TRAP transporter solute-binding subunit [Candidatus Thermoplasmatota archaeon]
PIAKYTPVTPPTVSPTVPTLPASGPNDDYAMTTGGSTGVYFAIGNGIAAAVRNVSNAGFIISDVATSQGSVQNAQRLRADDHQLATMQNDVLYEAYNGEGRFAGGAITELRAVGSLYSELIQIVTLQSANINSVAGLAGKRVVVGAAGSGAAINAGDVINASGVSMDVQYLDLSTGLDRLRDGAVDAVFWTGGIPTGAITSLATTSPVRIVPIDETIKNALLAQRPFYANATLPAGTYNGQAEAVETVAVRAVLVARSDVAADDVFRLLGIIYEGQDVKRSHAQGQNIRLEDAFLGVSGVPWHDGATAYFTSKGMTPPS